VDAFDVEALKEFLGSIGDSVVAFKTESIVKLHVHTFTPEKVLAHCRTFGEFLTVKIENMTLQHTESDKEVSFVMKAEAPAEEEPAVERKQYGVVAVSNGDGISSLLKELGTDEVVPGGQTQNPSTNDFLDAFSRVHAEHIFVFPNNGNIVMAARQAASLYEDATVHVIPSKNIGTGYVGISSIDFENPDPQAVIAQVESAMQRVTAGYVSPSIRDADMNGVHIEKGDTIGIIEKEIVVSEADMMTAATKLAVQLLDGPDKFMLTVFSGKDATENDRAALSAHLSDACPSAEVYFIDGGQDIYPFIFVAE
jgi:dihydroxyacetone kinase-like predicted kinase